MTPETSHPSDPPRARVSPADCQVCRGAGTLPSMTTAWVRVPCPRCLHALRPASNAVEKTEQAPFRLAGDPPDTGERRRFDDVDGRRVLSFVVGAACGAAFVVLVLGIFRVLG